ncbi:MAG: hypothetical protein A2Y38_12160 [Spirochaetes bacterium GWB1_59_5]|nr:MAG: hypothetical protein A2Y38_12160 [Spirochaetes bacterium GWB1_59_5]
MASFEIADRITRANEGGWQNDPNDRGNAASGLGTYRGVASRIHPGWKGWSIISDVILDLSPQPRFGTALYRAWVKKLNSVLHANEALQELVRSFYKTNFWDALRLDEIKSQAVANKVYDAGVNQGTGTAAVLLQRVLGAAADGQIGPITLALANKQNGDQLAEKFKQARIAKYQRIVEKNPTQAKYLDIWVARC